LDDYGNLRIIEIGARMGGDCIGSDLVQISTGYDFIKMVIEVAIGKNPELIRISEPKIAFIKFIFSKDDLKKLDIIKEKYNGSIYKISKISEFNHKVTDSSSRYGFYILCLNNYKELEEILSVVGVGENENISCSTGVWMS
jgi:cephalosporin hydroxylase